MSGRQDTRKRLIETQLSLMQETSYKNITVKEVAFEAGVSRRTFYRYFSSTFDLLKEHLQDITDELIEKTDTGGVFTHETFIEMVAKLFSDNRYFIRTVINDKEMKPDRFFDYLLVLMNRKLENIIQDSRYFDSDYLAAFTMGGTFELLRRWLDSDCDVSAAEISELICSIFSSLKEIEASAHIPVKQMYSAKHEGMKILSPPKET